MLRFGTAGLRGPLQDGPDGMNIDTVTRATAGIADWLRNRCLGGGLVIVGRDARHGSADFAAATAEVFAAAGFSVLQLPRPLPTPVVAYAVKALGAVAGVQITASHNPATDNGYKLYLDGGSQIVPPADAEIEACIDAVRTPVPRTDPTPTSPAPERLSLPAGTTGAEMGEAIVRRYASRVAELPHLIGDGNREPVQRSPIRIALTAMHGVGGELAVSILRAAGFDDVHVVSEQFAPDPDFPTVAFPNPEEPGASDLLLKLAEQVGADVAIALDPDADRCAVGVPGPNGWRMLRGDETGVLLGDFVLRSAAPDSLVATTIVSSRLLSKLAPARGARYAETLTGFKWLARAGEGLVYAYEEAIGHCVDPAAVRDKDGISAAVLAADLVAQLKAAGRTLFDVLDDFAVEFGVHAGDQVSLRLPDVTEAAAVVARLRETPPTEIAGVPVSCTDMSTIRGQMRTDALIFDGPSLRIVVRPSGTEPKLKCYLEAFEPVPAPAHLKAARAAATQRIAEMRAFCEKL
ncbi:phospho-sugar mutase [Nocardia huaxiensis]|uniref:Phospho-sugar mutase n=1 Tax=Nocardia huaxiensis TaxID=2755382 RepID=A0A7D6ZP74_9NOCA|nr:phospho-sugar mutase [Nocardia huaxiensis]QLY32023.1 phospho-sugar mutase [Nocardia huaxiensis]